VAVPDLPKGHVLDDGRWIAEALELPGVMTYGQMRDEAIASMASRSARETRR